MSTRPDPGDRRPADPLASSPSVERSGLEATDPDGGAHGGEPPETISARLSSAVTGPLAAATARLGRRIPGGRTADRAGRVTSDEAAAYEEALRQAFRAAAPVAPATPTPRLITEPDATPDAEAVAVAPHTEARPQPEAIAVPRPEAMPEASLPAVVAPKAEPPVVAPQSGATEPASLEAEMPEIDAPDAHAVVADVLEVGGLEASPQAAVVAVPTSLAPADAAPADAPRPQGARPPGLATTEDLLRVPGSVTTTADDFFAGLVRRVSRKP